MSFTNWDSRGSLPWAAQGPFLCSLQGHPRPDTDGGTPEAVFIYRGKKDWKADLGPWKLK